MTFDATYRDVPSLTRLVQDATVVVLPYDSQDQVTSGVLVDALAAGRPVVATAFPHAVELLSSGAGVVVPHRDATALGAALRHILTEPAACASMAREAARLAPGFAWTAVARQYAALADGLVADCPSRDGVTPVPSFEHLERMTDRVRHVRTRRRLRSSPRDTATAPMTWPGSWSSRAASPIPASR